ncbi:ParB/RepB/Spo0J family partition protein [Aquihabitans sp. G128]|uniref:ParB/RepB/Spo0J family partition protein n=1 Tax=Aquihabitans sp. G128 TaxID=2849779 RepID=UPI001C210949|nr:ParB/RepB/Spo0J family partition protein [Aquihabitans sp. G128]QXC59829.1 ParB/RepB/Spo0J family partition protein [Aquihabitans sp. G128]
MARRSGLGKGLGALIPSEVATSEDEAALRELLVSQIEPNPHQPRGYFDEEALVSLTASVAELGVLQPVLVRPVGQDRYELIAGERRWRAAKRAGLQAIPAVVRKIDDTASLEQAVVENLHRQDLNPLEEAAAYQQLIEDFRLSHDDVARRVGKSRSAVSNTLRLFQLPPGIQKLVAETQLSAGHARALLGTPDRSFQEALARRAVAESLSVREVEEAVRARSGQLDGDDAPAAGGGAGPSASSAGRRLRPPGLLELEELLSDRLDTRVKVSMGAKRGKVTIDFATLEDLERIYRAMTTPPVAED